MELIVTDPDTLPLLMHSVLEGLAGRRKVAVYGEMGTGKTTFVKAFCAELGVLENTTSPTYSLVNEYSYTDRNGSSALFHHLDLYRLDRQRDALDMGIEELLYDPWYCFIEWPQLIEPIFPPETAKIYIELTGETARRVLIV
jgi:tRNA threonylcarbamoyladenosine biosynthesis protein TsaE